MKQLLPILLISLVSLAAQNIEVTDNQLLNNLPQNLALPHYSPDGQSLVLTSPNLQGIWIYDLNNGTVIQLNDLPSAGLSPFFLNPDTVVFRADVLVSPLKSYHRTFQIFYQPLSSRTPLALTEPERNLSQLSASRSGIYFTENGENHRISADGRLTGMTKSSDPVLLNSLESIRIIRDGAERQLKPSGDGHYLWCSLSPDKTQILFTKAGEGTFICDLDGNDIISVGYLNAPKWSPDGQWLAGMKDSDDGYVITKSELAVYNVSAHQEYILTQTDSVHEMNPDWSPAGDAIAYDTFDGRIGLLSVILTGGEQ